MSVQYLMPHASFLITHSCIYMTEREFFIYTINDEAPRFDRALKAVPSENSDWKPDPKSKTAMEIANSIAMEAGTLKTILETGDLDFSKVPKQESTIGVDAAKVCIQALNEVRVMAEKMTDSDWEIEARMHIAGAHEWKTTKGKMVWSFILDLIHHRGQMSTYIRAMGGKVPSIYGPSADTAE